MKWTSVPYRGGTDEIHSDRTRESLAGKPIPTEESIEQLRRDDVVTLRPLADEGAM